jgi:hypothetical protein
MAEFAVHAAVPAAAKRAGNAERVAAFRRILYPVWVVVMATHVNRSSRPMKFIEMSGKTLQRIISDDELHPDELAELGVTDESVVRINRQGDIELRRADRWDLIGGLLGEFEHRIQSETGLTWV